MKSLGRISILALVGVDILLLAPASPADSFLPLISKGPVRIELQQVATGLNAPNDLTSVGDGRLFVDEQSGTIRIVENNVLLATPFLDLSARLVKLSPTGDERGLLGLTFHPGFNDPSSPGFRKFYTYTSEPVSGPADFTVPKTTAFAELLLNPSFVEPDTVVAVNIAQGVEIVDSFTR